MVSEISFNVGISSRGRIRKRRIIPNNIEDQGLRKRRKEPDHSPSPTPNILQRSKSPAAAAVTSTAGQPQYKAVLNQLHMPGNLTGAKGKVIVIILTKKGFLNLLRNETSSTVCLFQVVSNC